MLNGYGAHVHVVWIPLTLSWREHLWQAHAVRQTQQAKWRVTIIVRDRTFLRLCIALLSHLIHLHRYSFDRIDAWSIDHPWTVRSPSAARWYDTKATVSDRLPRSMSTPLPREMHSKLNRLDNKLSVRAKVYEHFCSVKWQKSITKRHGNRVCVK